MNDETTSETLRTLAETIRAVRDSEATVVIAPEFLESVADELDGVNSLKIYSSSGELVCTIGEPLASSVVHSAVQKYIERALRESLENPNS